MALKNDARGSLGFFMLPSRAVGGILTWLKHVNEWLIGREPPRGGKALEGRIKLLASEVWNQIMT